MRRRDQGLWGFGANATAESPTLPLAEDTELVHELCHHSLKWLYCNVLTANRPQGQQCVGKLHDYLFDFLRWEELPHVPKRFRKATIQTDLIKYLPQHTDGIYRERWLYWPTLDQEPRIEDGAHCELSKLFHKGELMSPSMPGLLMRLKDDGLIKSVMFPRGHLKSEIANYAVNMQEIVRDSSVRIMVRSGEEGLAEKLISMVKATFENNPEFRAYYHHLGPPAFKEAVWSNEALQVLTPHRRSADPTLSAVSIMGSATGYHVDYSVFDDCVTLDNVNTQDTIKKKLRDTAFINDKKVRLMNIGTIYRDNDAHSMFIRPGGGLYPFSSFIVATVLDAAGKPIWPEGMNERELAKRKAFCGDDEYFYYCQYWNNPFIGRVEGFNAAWLQDPYLGEPETIAEELGLEICVTVDGASKTRKKNDYTTVIVQGQTPDCSRRYVLDGLRDRIPYDKAPKVLVDIAEKWQRVARKAKGGFKFGIEQVAFVEYLEEAMRSEMRRRGISFEIKPLKHGNKSKEDRIRKLMPLYSAGMILLPAKVLKTASDGTSYDLVEVYRDEYAKFPRASHDDLMDAHAYQEDLLRPVPIKGVERKKAEKQFIADEDQGRSAPAAETEQRSRYTGRPLPPQSKLARLARRDVGEEPGPRARYTGRYTPRRGIQ